MTLQLQLQLRLYDITTYYCHVNRTSNVYSTLRHSAFRIGQVHHITQIWLMTIAVQTPHTTYDLLGTREATG